MNMPNLASRHHAMRASCCFGVSTGVVGVSAMVFASGDSATIPIMQSDFNFINLFSFRVHQLRAMNEFRVRGIGGIFGQ